ncbi:MAG: hypothetical protein ACJA2X_000755 [Halocynthiibacter sp.]|jgi:hypothetical protein
MIYYSKDVSEHVTLKISPMNSRLSQYVYSDFDLNSKYFLYRSNAISTDLEIEVLAAIPDDDAAFQMSQLLGLS